MHRPLNITVSKYGMVFKEKSKIMCKPSLNTPQSEEIKTLNRLFEYLKMNDISIFYDKKGNLHVKDEEKNHWVNKEVYKFIFEDALCFDDSGELSEGCYVEQTLLESIKTFAFEYGVYP